MPRALSWLLPALSLLGLSAGLCLLSSTHYVDALSSSTASVGANTFNTDTLAAPTAPSATGGTSIVLNWTATTSTYASGYHVLRGTASGGPYSQIAQVTPRTTTTYTDSASSGTYYYVVRAYYQNWESANSSEVSASVSAVIAFVKNVGTAANTSGALSFSITVPAAGVAAGDLVVVRTDTDSNTAISTVTDTRGNSYSFAAGANYFSTVMRGEVWYSKLTTALQSGDTITVAWPSSSNERRAIAADEFSGVAATKDVSSTANGTSTTPLASVTTTNAGDLIIGYTAVNCSTSDTYTEASGWAVLTRSGTNSGSSASNVTVDGGYKIVSTTGTYTHNPTLGTNRGWTEVDVAFKGQ